MNTRPIVRVTAGMPYTTSILVICPSVSMLGQQCFLPTTMSLAAQSVEITPVKKYMLWFSSDFCDDKIYLFSFLLNVVG